MAQGAEQNYAVQRRVRPIGNLLNDNDSGVDQLEYLVYAQALARLLHNCRPPITVGIFAPWGNGKTFLLKHVQGLLRKFERQHMYDAVHKNGKGQRGSTDVKMTEEQSERLAKRKPKNKTRKATRRRCCTCGICSCIFVLVIAVLAILVGLTAHTLLNRLVESPDRNATSGVSFEPEVRIPRIGNTNSSTGGNISGSGFGPRIVRPPIGTTALPPASSTTVAEEGDRKIIDDNVGLYVAISLALFAFMVFTVIYCCIANTTSKCWPRFRHNISLIFYAAFTRLPSGTACSTWTEASDPYMVISLNDDKAEVRSLDPMDEEAEEESSGKGESMPCRYIFVNYRAWEYAGSDTLWAGIVTTLSDAIEEEFGSVTVRLFRMMQVERPSKAGPLKTLNKDDPRAIYVRLKGASEDTISEQYGNLYRIMVQYGVVTRCCLAEKCGDGWWFVRFSSKKEADFAETALKLDGFKIERQRPHVQKPENPSSTRQNGIELTDVGSSRGRSGGVATDTEAGQQGEESEKLLDKNTQSASACDVQCAPYKSSGCCRFCRQFRRHPKTVCCGCPYLYCFLVFILAALVLPVAITIMATYLELGVLKSTRAIPIEVQILSWFPATLGVFVVALRFCWAMCHSQTERIRKALAGAKGNMADELGFMNNVKNEVKIMTQLINCVRFTHRINYKIVITIDDLDRCPTDKVKPVLEALNILLSDRSSPFICLVGVDSRVAVKCIETDLGEVLLKANLTGHEYLKKIINLPFCLPEVANNAKQKYIGGLMDAADKTKVWLSPVPKPAVKENRNRLPRKPCDRTDAISTDTLPGPSPTDDESSGAAVGDRSPRVTTDGRGWTDPDHRTKGPAGHSREGGDTRPVQKFLSFSEFLIACRRFLQNDPFLLRHVHGNPRNIKRIFNVLSLTTHMMQCMEDRRERRELLAKYAEKPTYCPVPNTSAHRKVSIVNSDLSGSKGVCLGRTEEDAEDLVRWIVLTDQWPYRMSYILQVIEDSDQMRGARVKVPEIKGSFTLSEVYERFVEPELAANNEEVSGMLALDEDPALLRSLLRRCSSLTRRRVASLFPVTLNLDQSLRNGIGRERSKHNPVATATGDEGRAESATPASPAQPTQRTEEAGDNDSAAASTQPESGVE